MAVACITFRDSTGQQPKIEWAVGYVKSNVSKDEHGQGHRSVRSSREYEKRRDIVKCPFTTECNQVLKNKGNSVGMHGKSVQPVRACRSYHFIRAVGGRGRSNVEAIRTHSFKLFSASKTHSPISLFNKMKYTAVALFALIAAAAGHPMVTPTATPTATPVVEPTPAAHNGAAIEFGSGNASASGNNAIAVGADMSSGSAAASGEDLAAAMAGPGFAGALAGASPAV